MNQKFGAEPKVRLLGVVYPIGQKSFAPRISEKRALSTKGGSTCAPIFCQWFSSPFIIIAKDENNIAAVHFEINLFDFYH